MIPETLPWWVWMIGGALSIAVLAWVAVEVGELLFPIKTPKPRYPTAFDFQSLNAAIHDVARHPAISLAKRTEIVLAIAQAIDVHPLLNASPQQIAQIRAGYLVDIALRMLDISVSIPPWSDQ